MSGDCSTSAALALADMASLLAEMADAMCVQAQFHLDDKVVFGTHSLQQAATISAQRALRAPGSGVNQLAAMKKTVTFELVQATLLAQAVLGNAAMEAWPDLESIKHRALWLLRKSLEESPGLLGNVGIGPADLEQGLPALALAGPGWRKLKGDTYACQHSSGQVASVVGIQLDGKKEWMARIGQLGIAIHCDALNAAIEAWAACEFLFASRAGILV